MVLPCLYPHLKRGRDCKLYDKGMNNKEGTQIRWLNKDVPPPTDKELLDGKVEGLTQHWWMILRLVRDKLLRASDAHAMPDRPDSDKWIPYRKKLRDLPETVSPPSFEVLNNESTSENKSKIEKLMPDKP